MNFNDNNNAVIIYKTMQLHCMTVVA